MSSNMYPGRKTDRVEIYGSGGVDDWGVPTEGALLGTLACDVMVRSGDQNADFGVDLRSEVITVLADRRDYVKNLMTLKWVNRPGGQAEYEIVHVKPADMRNLSMIITAELMPNGG